MTDRRKLPQDWRWVKLGNVCELTTDTLNPQDVPSEVFAHYSIPAYDHGQVPTFESGSSILSNKGLFPCGAVLFSKLNPRISRVWYVQDSHNRRRICSTEFLPLLPRVEVLDPKYLRFALQEPRVLSNLRAQVAAATKSRERLKPESVMSSEIPLPPLTEQRRIAAILDHRLAAIDRARAATQVQLEAAQALPGAYLSAVFRTAAAKNWPRRLLGEMCDIVARQVDPKIPEYGALPHVNGENIESGTGRLTYLHTAAEERMTSGKYLFESGDVLYSKLRPYLRKVVVVDFRGVCSADMYPIRANRDLLDPHFAVWMLLSDEFTEYADAESRRARMPKLNREQLFAWRAPAPDVREQQRIAASLSEMIAKARHLRQILDGQIGLINGLPATLLRQAFNGEL